MRLGVCGFVGMLAVSATLLSGCGLGETRVEQGTREGVLHMGNDTEPQELDPHVVTGVPEHKILSALFEGLTILNPDTLEPEPAAAESWEVSEDGRVYTFHLREDARWSNGDPVTAHDFVYAWERILSPALASEYAYMLHVLENARAFNEGEIDDFGEVGAEAIDDYTLQATLTHPTPYFLSMQVHYTWFPVHQETIEAHGAMDERGTQWTRPGNHVSNGPFHLTEWRPNRLITVEKSDYYWDADTVQLNAIKFYPIDSLQTEERTFRAGGLHVTGDVPLTSVPSYRENRPDLIHIHPWAGTYFYRFNVNSPPLDDVRVRRALAMTIDREAIVESITRAGEQPASAFVPPEIGDYVPEAELPHDPEAARALLEEAGYPGGQGMPTVELLYNTSDNHRILAEAVQNMWREELGVNVSLVNQDWAVYLSTMNNLDYQIARSGWIADFLDPINFLECFVTGGGNNRTGFSDADFDRLIDEAREEPDTTAREALLHEAEAILMEEAPIAPVYYYTRKHLRSPDVRGWNPNPMGYVAYKHVWLEPSGAPLADEDLPSEDGEDPPAI